MKQKLLDGHSKMRKDIADAKDKHLKEIWIFIRNEMENLPKDRFLDEVEYRILKSLEETYSITASAAKEIYNITFTDKIDDITLEQLTYSADGKTLMDRLSQHYDNAIERDDPTMYFYNRIVVIMDSETLYASNHIIHGKLKRRATHAEVINPNKTCYEHEECEYWFDKGKMPIQELEEMAESI